MYLIKKLIGVGPAHLCTVYVIAYAFMRIRKFAKN